MYRLSLFYFVVGLVTGLFHHEVKYWTNFTGSSVLKYVHPHAIIRVGSLFFMGFRGVIKLYELPISSFLDHMIGVLAGISYVILTVVLFFLYQALQSLNKEIE